MIFRRKEKVLTTDMTQGNIPRLIINFALPLMMGNLFQQLYNTVDSIIVGNYVGKEALAAIGATSPFVNTLIGFFMGFATGSGILRALGDSRRPVLFLIISSLVNVVLDLLFVIDNVLLYFIFLRYINNGIFHIYFFFTIKGSI